MNNREQLKKFFSLFHGNSRVLVVINADPDAISSAMAIKRLLWRKVKEVTISHFNKITRPDNLAMIEYTEPGLIALDEIDKKDFNAFVIVDSQPDHNPRFLEFDFDAIIDHHPVSCENARGGGRTNYWLLCFQSLSVGTDASRSVLVWHPWRGNVVHSDGAGM